MSTMRALRAHVRGGPDVLRYETAPIPQPAPDEVQVEVHAAAITFDELTWDETWTRDGQDRTPIIPSHEFSGIVSGRGTEVTDVAIGSEVYGLVPFDRNGAAADYLTLPVSDVARKPRSLSHIDTAALPLAALTAWQALVDHAHVQPGDRVLVQGAAGGVGGFVTQLGAILGARVTAAIRSTDTSDTVRGYGATDIITISGDSGATQDHGSYDVVIDTIGGASLEPSLRVVRPGGHHVGLSAPPPPDAAQRYGITTSFFIVTPNHDQLAHLADLADAGQLTVTLAGIFDLADGKAAYASRSVRPRRPGKTVLRIRC